MLALDLATGISIPQGDPGVLFAAARAWGQLGSALDRQAAALDSAASTVMGADWSGQAAMAYGLASQEVSVAYRSGAGACREMAGSCQAFGHELQDAQQEAKAAIRDAQDALERQAAAQAKLADAQARGASAEQAAADAHGRAAVAGALGPAGHAAAEVARTQARSAEGEAQAAHADASRAAHELERADEDLARARKRGRAANEHAQQAAQRAAGAFEACAGAAQPPTMVGAPAVPVTVRGNAVSGLAALDGHALADLRHPLFTLTPSDVRRSQIAQAEAAAAEAEHKQLGNFWDFVGGGLAGFVGASFGVGNPATRQFRNAKTYYNAVSWIPSPAMVEKQFAKRAAKKELEHWVEGPVRHSVGGAILRAGLKGRLDYASDWRSVLRDVADNFKPGTAKAYAGTLQHDLVLVAYHRHGEPHSWKWWTSVREASTFHSAEDVHDRLALPRDWSGGQLRDEKVIIRIPKGTHVSYIHGTAEGKQTLIDSRDGGGEQFRFLDFDDKWIVGRGGVP